MLGALKRYGVILLAWMPFFVVWTLLALSYGRMSLRGALVTTAISMGGATALGTGVWYLCGRLPWPLRPTLKFYLIHTALALAYTIIWTTLICAFESIRQGEGIFHQYWRSPEFGWQLLTGAWIYCLFAGVSYATQIRDRLHNSELFAQKAEALANAARLDAIRARLNPHFLFNALHTLSALVKFHPLAAEQAIERLGDMLRYALKENSRDLVEFSEEFEFTKQYLAFEQLRYEQRLQVEIRIDPECANFDVPPFSIQTLAENAVRHAISVRPEGGRSASVAHPGTAGCRSW
jgi:two-component system LytT family sensor kinase